MRLRPLAYLVALFPSSGRLPPECLLSSDFCGSSSVPWLFVPSVNFSDELTGYEHWAPLEQPAPPPAELSDILVGSRRMGVLLSWTLRGLTGFQTILL